MIVPEPPDVKVNELGLFDMTSVRPVLNSWLGDDVIHDGWSSGFHSQSDDNNYYNSDYDCIDWDGGEEEEDGGREGSYDEGFECGNVGGIMRSGDEYTQTSSSEASRKVSANKEVRCMSHLKLFYFRRLFDNICV